MNTNNLKRRIFRKLLLLLPEIFLEEILSVKKKRIAPILLYHLVQKTTTNPLISENIHNVFPEVFEKQILLLKKYFAIVPVEELVYRRSKNQSIDNLAAITFDDGYRSVFAIASPILEKMEVPFTIFTTAALSEKKMFWRDKVRWVIQRNRVNEFIEYGQAIDESFSRLSTKDFFNQSKDPLLMNSKLIDKTLDSFIRKYDETASLEALGKEVYFHKTDVINNQSPLVSFGNHTLNHYVLSSLSDKEQYDEIYGCHQYLKSLGKEPLKIFSIPFGGFKDYNIATLLIVKELGYVGYLLSGQITNKPGKLPKSKLIPLIPLYRFLPRNNIKKYLIDFVN
jgi:peptidoglycan/xylan/chitin deacetylase (PgdA/CDA1 family)